MKFQAIHIHGIGKFVRKKNAKIPFTNTKGEKVEVPASQKAEVEGLLEVSKTQQPGNRARLQLRNREP